MGKPTTSHVVVPTAECIGGVEGTRGSETSQYPQEEKTNSDSVSSGERKRRRLNLVCSDTRQGLQVRGCGTCLQGLPALRRVRAVVVEAVVSAVA